MNSYTLSPIKPVNASGPGALSGFERTCSCGLTLRSSLLELLAQDSAQHLQYHAKHVRRGW